MMPRDAAVWVVDTEFQQLEGERPTPHCMVARNVHTGQELRSWLGDGPVPVPPFLVDGSIVVTYYASAELGTFLACGWPLPAYVLDLWTEFRLITNDGRHHDRSLVDARLAFGLGWMDVFQKDTMRQLAIRGGPYDVSEREALLAYCADDVQGTVELYQAMRASIPLEPALLRGEYWKAIAHMERNGIPIDGEVYETLQDRWPAILHQLIARVDTAYGCFEGSHFNFVAFERYLLHQGIDWPRTSTGRLATDRQTFRDMKQAYPVLEPLYELRTTLSETRPGKLTLGHDGRNRVMLRPFATKTGRNAPSTNTYIFGPATWLRHLIRPEPGKGLAYVDWEQQEFGIAAVLSHDAKMLQAYESGDCYLTFAKQAGAIPADATKETHAQERGLFKACVLATQYGMGPVAFAVRSRLGIWQAQHLLGLHRETYQTFWKWSDAILDHVQFHGSLESRFGWELRVPPGRELGNPRTWRNFPMQSNGAEMLRLACSKAIEQGVCIVAPVHDAMLIKAPAAELEYATATIQACMAWASRLVLDGFELRTDATLIRWPERYQDERGASMWRTVRALLEEETGVPIGG